AHRRMLEGERSAFFSVAADTARFVGGDVAHHSRTEAAVRVVAIDTGHRAFGQTMLVGFRKLVPRACMARRALCVNRAHFPRNHPPPAMPRSARDTGDLTLGMPTFDPAGMSRLIQMALEASTIDFCRREFGGVTDLIGRSRFRVLTAWAVTGFTGLSIPA